MNIQELLKDPGMILLIRRKTSVVLHKIHHKLLERLMDKEDWEQEVMLGLMTSIHKYNKNRGTLDAWLYAAIRNIILNNLRHMIGGKEVSKTSRVKKMSVLLPNSTTADTGATIEGISPDSPVPHTDNLSATEAIARLRRVLPPRYNIILDLQLLGFRTQAVAQILCLHEQTIRNMLGTIQERLRT
jgi:RNA polymerase sigma factor (sigma-70 family)